MDFSYGKAYTVLPQCLSSCEMFPIPGQFATVQKLSALYYH